MQDIWMGTMAVREPTAVSLIGSWRRTGKYQAQRQREVVVSALSWRTFDLRLALAEGDPYELLGKARKYNRKQYISNYF